MKPIDNQIRALGMVLPDGLWEKKQSTLQGLKGLFHSGLETLFFPKHRRMDTAALH
jgi:hypothetical protein